VPLESYNGIPQKQRILYVMRLHGHRNIKNTLIYTQLIDGIQEDEFLCRVAKNPAEIQELVEAGC